MINESEYQAKRREILAEQGQERSPAERLTTLNELKSKGLISEGEYQAKRQEILKEL